MAERPKPKPKDGRVPPHNLEAEESLLGACILSKDALTNIIDLVAVEDFMKPAHQILFDQIRVMYRVFKPIDAVTLAEELRASGHLDDIGGLEFILSLTHRTPAISNVVRYAEIVVAASQQRALIAVAAALLERAYGEADIAESILETKAALDMAAIKGRTRVTVVGGEEFMAKPPAPYDWIQEQIIERNDRLLLTGGEGGGKSIILLQWAVMTAAGVHWWTMTPVPAKRCTFIDLELGEKRTRRRVELFATPANWASDHWRGNLAIYSRSEDIDLSTRAGASWVASILDQTQPDLLIIGPIYRLTSGVTRPGDIGGEDAAKRAAFALDKIIERFDCGLLTETHAAKGDIGRGRDMRPFGSSVWTRWPEFGYALARQGGEDADPNARNWEHWRGDRDPRQWPDRFLQSNIATDWRMQAEFDVTPPWYSSIQNPRDVTIVRGRRDDGQGTF